MLDEISTHLPGALYVWPTRRSYTGEPLVEWHTYGSPPLLDASLRTICRAGARLAEPGEFTLRAFLAGRIDLTQAEAVLGVIDARDRGELDRALGQLAGGLAQPLAGMRRDLVNLLVDLEAGLDFVEEGIEFVQQCEIRRRLGAAAVEVSRIAEQMASRGDSSDLPRIVLRGWPNVGKSSLFNALIGQEGAIVSAQSSTTRDYLVAQLDCGKVRCRLIDTAGVVPGAQHPIERAAQSAASEQVEEAEVELLCLDASRPMNDWEREELSRPPSNTRLVVLTKADAEWEAVGLVANEIAHIRTSSRTGQGLDQLRSHIAEALADRSESSSIVAATAARSRDAVHQARVALAAALAAADEQQGEELIAAEIRAALDGLGAVVGAVYTDELLEGIFSRFCIGK